MLQELATRPKSKPFKSSLPLPPVTWHFLKGGCVFFAHGCWPCPFCRQQSVGWARQSQTRSRSGIVYAATVSRPSGRQARLRLGIAERIVTTICLHAYNIISYNIAEYLLRLTQVFLKGQIFFRIPGRLARAGTCSPTAMAMRRS